MGLRFRVGVGSQVSIWGRILGPEFGLSLESQFKDGFWILTQSLILGLESCWFLGTK